MNHNDNDVLWNESNQQAVTPQDANFNEEEYETLYPDPRGGDILIESKFYSSWMPAPTDQMWMDIAGNRSIMLGFQVIASLIGRVTRWRFNWKTETLRSFLEVLVWMSVTGVAYNVYRDALWAAQIGFSVGLAMSVCDEVFVAGTKSAFQSIVEHPQGAAFLRRWGFDVVSSKRLKGDSYDDVSLFKTIVFSALALETVRHVYMTSIQDFSRFAVVTTAMGVAFVLMGELFCLWLPTRRLGQTVQSRWTHIGRNWDAHFTRSLVEVTCWILCLFYVYSTTASLGDAVLWSSILGTGMCIAGGLDDTDAALKECPPSFSSYWDQWASGGCWMTCAAALTSLQAKVE